MGYSGAESIRLLGVTTSGENRAARTELVPGLAELAGLELAQDDKALLERLSLYYLQSRYPPEIQALAKQITRSVAMTHMAQTEALWKRLRRRLIRTK